MSGDEQYCVEVVLSVGVAVTHSWLYQTVLMSFRVHHLRRVAIISSGGSSVGHTVGPRPRAPPV